MIKIHQNISVAYEKITKTIIMDSDLDQIDFPLLSTPIEPESIANFLSEELMAKIEFENLEKAVKVESSN